MSALRGAARMAGARPVGHRVPRTTVCRAEDGGSSRARDDDPRGGTYLPVRRQVPSSRSAGSGRGRPADPPTTSRSSGAPTATTTTTLRRSDVVDKQIVTRMEGKQLGKVTDLWIDTRRWEVVSLDCQPPSSLFKGTLDKVTAGNTLYSVLLGSLRQIGDVVLVQDIRALEMEDFSYGCSNIVSWEVRDESGSMLGKVRDFHFSPDNGAVAGLIFDMFGSPIVPPSAVSTYSIGIEQVIRVENGKITVMNGYRAQQLSVGFLDKFLNVAEEQIGPLFEDVVPEEAEEYERRLAKWREEMAEYERQYGPMPAEVRRRAETTLQPQDRTVQRAEDGRRAELERARAQQEQGKKVASIPIISQRRRGPAYQQRDADGGFGERPPPRRRALEERPPQPQEPSVSFDEWLQEEEREMQAEPLAMGYGEARGEAMPLRREADGGRPADDFYSRREADAGGGRRRPPLDGEPRRREPRGRAPPPYGDAGPRR